MGGFKYVLIPASPNEEMKELHFDQDIDDLTKDTFREKLEEYYRMGSQAVDRDILLAQLQQRTGVDLKAEAEKGQSAADIDRLLSSTSVEIFPVQMPTKETGWHSISAYCDDKGVAKGLEENTRMSGLIQAAGFPGQTFRGDCFLGRVLDDTEDEWRRLDFPMTDVNADAEWVISCKKQRSKRSVNDMTSLSNTLGMKNPANVNAAAIQDTAPAGETAEYAWRQAGDEVEVTFKKDGLSKGDKKEVKVVFGRQRLKVEAKGEVLIDAELYAATQADEATWTLSDGVLQVTITKAEDESWPQLLKE